MQPNQSEILDKLKSRVPMFILSVYCTTITLLFGTSPNFTDSNTVELFPTFKIYYCFLLVLAFGWDLWHCARATNVPNDRLINKIGFAVISMFISLTMFVLSTSIVSFGFPLVVFFGLKKESILLIYGSLLPALYFLHVFETNMWEKYAQAYDLLENKDDMEGDPFKNKQ